MMKRFVFVFICYIVFFDLKAQLIWGSWDTHHYNIQVAIANAEAVNRAQKNANHVLANAQSELDDIRDKYWKADSKGIVSDELFREYSTILHNKDLFYFYLKFIDDITTKTYGLNEGISPMLNIFFDPFDNGGILDGGIAPMGQSEFDAWYSTFTRYFFKEDDRRKVFNYTLVKSILERDELTSLYQAYVVKRDTYESIYENNYTSGKYISQYNEAVDARAKEYEERQFGWKSIHPYHRKRLFMTFDKLEKEIQTKPTIDVLTKYQAPDPISNSQGGMFSVYFSEPYQLGRRVELPFNISTTVFKFGEGRHPKSGDSLEINYYNLAENVEDPIADQIDLEVIQQDIVHKIYDKTIYSIKQIGSAKMSFDHLPKDMQFLVSMMKKGGIWHMYLNKEYGTIDESLEYYASDEYYPSNNSYVILIELVEIE